MLLKTDVCKLQILFAGIRYIYWKQYEWKSAVVNCSVKVYYSAIFGC